MQQRFSTRNCSVRDFEEWHEKDELVLAPKFQRREVWSDKARSYLMDTIIRGKPIPKIYMRQDTNPETRRTTREIVDGQQRLKTILSFIKDGFKLSKVHHETFGGKFFSGLDIDTQRDILKYEFVVDLLQDMPDKEVYDVFARINTYAVSLKPQELRNAKWFGEFKTTVYVLANDFVTFWEQNKIFSSKQMLRMAEAEFVSELLIAMTDGINEGSKKQVIDGFYKEWDDEFPNRKTQEKRFRECIDAIGNIFGEGLPTLKLKSLALFYPMFCAIFHLKYGLPKLTAPRMNFKSGDYPKLRSALEAVDEMIVRVEDADIGEGAELTAEERRFYEAYDEHWVHAENRTIMTTHFCKVLVRALRD